ncbi:uncharacterized protein [Watersipora subatra]|uniref:uncharacterized protein n=1 Tax=Watersipora subatra TaxID=2589382 RepID=UPI00355B8286
MEDFYYLVSISPHVMKCTMELSKHDNSSSSQWLFVTNEVLYYLLPIVIGVALLFTLLNSIVFAKMVTDSHECYLTGFHISSFVLILSSVFMHILTYAPFNEPEIDYAYLTIILPYVLVIENWCFYTCTWLLLTAVAERTGHALCGQWHSSFGRIHGILASLLIIVVSFVCTLPQYWEYTTAVVYDEHGDHNCSRMVIAPVNDILKLGGGYISEYLYYNWVLMVFSIALPYLVLPILLPPMCCVKMHAYSALSTNGGQMSTYADDYVSKDYMRDERNFNRLLSAVVLLYLLLSGPRNAAKLFHNPPFFMKLCDDDLMYATLIILFDVLFYLMFFLLFVVNMCTSAKFRQSLKSLRSKCCIREP